MRFDCGTLGDLTLPEDRRLSEIDSSSVVRFRVKVVDNTAHMHRIVAAADDITVSAAATDGGATIPLLPGEFPRPRRPALAGRARGRTARCWS